MARGFVYLAAVADWFSRRVLAWRVSIIMEVDFCLEAVEEALVGHAKTTIFNTDQGSQGGFKRSSQHRSGGSCDVGSETAFGSVWRAIVFTRPRTGGRTR
jgi:transposase InsO family protein